MGVPFSISDSYSESWILKILLFQIQVWAEVPIVYGRLENMSLKLNRPKSGSISSSTVDNEASYKLVMVGDSGVGKSCLLDKFLDDSSANNFISTIGVDIKTRETTINNRKIKVQVCGQKVRYKILRYGCT